MFKIVKRLIDWTGQYKKRIYIGFIYAFLHSIFTAIPIMLATYGSVSYTHLTLPTKRIV